MNEAIKAEDARVDALGHTDMCNYLALHMSEDHRRCFVGANKTLEELGQLELERLMVLCNQSKILFPSLDRGTGGEVLELIANADADHKLPIQSELEFATDWLSCEWAYIVDMDEEQLKIFGCMERCYEGHPFEDVGGDGVEVPRLLATFSFAELQSLDKEKFKERAEDIERSLTHVKEEHYRVVEERLNKVGIVRVRDNFGANEGDTSECDTGMEDASEGDEIDNDANEEDVMGDDTSVDGSSGDEASGQIVNGHGVDANVSQMDQLHLD